MTTRFYSKSSNNKEEMQTVKELREYGRFLGIRGLWRKNKERLREHLFDTVLGSVNDRMLRRPDMDPARAYMEAELSLRAEKLTRQKTWKRLHNEARVADIPVNRRTTKRDVERRLVQKRVPELTGRYRKTRAKKSLLREVEDLAARMDLVEEGARIRRFQITGNLNHVSTRLIMDKITPHIEMRTKVIYSFVADVYRGEGEITEYTKTLSAPSGMFTSLAEIQVYIEECEQKRLDLDNDEVWSKAYMPGERTTDVKGSHMGKVVFKHVQVKLIASNEPLMGCGPLPEWLAKKRCIYSVDKFDDNLCVWRCLVIFKRGEVKDVAMRTCEAALRLACEYYNESLRRSEVRATKLVDFEGIAKHHNLNIMLYEPKGKVGKDLEIWRLVYGKIQYKRDLPTLNIGLLDGHCFYIKNLDVLCKKWECKGCRQVFTHSSNLTKHLIDRCTGGKTKVVCKGRKFKRIFNASERVFYGGDTKFSFAACQWIEAESRKLGKHIHHKMCGHGGEREVTVWIEDEEGGKKAYRYPVDGYEPETNTVYQYHGCKWHGHSCLESRTNRQTKRYISTMALDGHIARNGYNLVKVWECEKPKLLRRHFDWGFTPYPHFIVFDFEARMLPMNRSQTEDLTYINRQVGVSVAIHDTLGGEPIYLEDSDPKELTRRFMRVLHEKQEVIVQDVVERFPYPEDFEMLPATVRVAWKQWVEQVPIYGFNSGKYDLNLVKEYLVKAVSLDEEGNHEKVKVAKKDNSYMFLMTSKFKFLDVRNYLAPGQSLDMWCRSMGCTVQKLVFPYEWLDGYEKLDAPCESIVWTDFLSSLDGRKEAFLTPSIGCLCESEANRERKAKEAYRVFVTEYVEKRHFTVMREVLKEYNIVDVVPFVEAVEKTRRMYQLDKIDMLKDAVSIPGISMAYVLNKAVKLDKKLELYTPGGLCEKCRDREEDCRACDCMGACADCAADKTTTGKCKCEETTAYELLKTGMVGGPAIVFCRYHETGTTQIRSHVYGEEAKDCGGIIGYDANALYLYCSGDQMPCGKETLVVNRRPYEEKRIKKFCRNVLKDKVFGFAQVDVEVPLELYDRFSEMAPLFVVQEIPEGCIPEHMHEYLRETGRKRIPGTRKLCGLMKATRILLYTPLIKWYLSHGLCITAVHQLLEYTPGKPFAWFPEEVTIARREADQDASKKVLGDTAKLKGNSFYGKMIEDKARHTSTCFTSREDDVDKALRSAYFVDMEEIGEAYEIKENKRTVQIDRPYQCGIAVYQLAKLRMLEFHYDFLDKFFDRRDYELMYMDTDSEYIAFSSLDIDSLVKPGLKKQYEKEKSKWIASDKYSERTPGIFKPEFVGARGVFLTAKCYIVQNNAGVDKFSCKGVSKKQNDMTFQRYKNCLFESTLDKASNIGFRVYDQGIVTYKQEKLGLSAYYDKRCVLEDGIHTRPL